MKNSNTIVAFLNNILCAIFEIISGYFTNSIAIISDSIHDLLDSFIILIIYLTEKKSKKKADNKYTYGYKRYAALGTLICSIMLLIGGMLALKRAISRILNPETIDVDNMIIVCTIGLIINLITLYKMKPEKTHKHISPKEILLEDIFTWIMMFITAIVIKKTGLYILDSILSVGISLYIFLHAFKCLLKLINIFMEVAPNNINIEELKSKILENRNIVKISNIHLWSVDEDTNCIILHILIYKHVKKDEYINTKQYIKDIVSKYNIQDISIDIDYENIDMEGIIDEKE